MHSGPFTRLLGAMVVVSLVSLAAPLPGRVLGAQGGAQLHPGEYSPSDIAKGQDLYRAQCAGCHGPNGDLVGTVNLRRGTFRNAQSDEDLIRLVQTGIPASGMPAFQLRPEEITAIVAFIRSGLDVSSRAVKLGDPARGRKVFEGKGACANCHRVNGVGKRSAPDLSEIGIMRPPTSLQGSLLDPSGQMMPINRPVRAVTRDGKVITGRRLNEDTYTIQLLDDKEQLVSLDKTTLREYQILTTSPMPSYRDKLTADEVADVVAYLASLKGKG